MIRNGNKDSNPTDAATGSEWTSFSDLFTSLAIIFLVLFVFSLVKLSLTKMEQVATIKGNFSKTQQVKSNQRKEKINDSIQKIKNYKETINEQMSQFNKTVTQLTSHQKIMDELVQEQAQKDSIIKQIKKNVVAQETKLKEMKNERIALARELESKNVELQKRVDTQIEQHRLAKTIDKKTDVIQNLQHNIELKSKDLKILEESLNHNSKRYQEQIAELENKVDMTQSEKILALKAKDQQFMLAIEKKEQELKEKELNYSLALTEKLEELNRKKYLLENQSSKLSDSKKVVKGLKEDQKKLLENLSSKSNILAKTQTMKNSEIERLEKQVQELGRKIKAKELNVAVLQNKNMLIEEQYQNSLQDIDKLKNVKRAPASTFEDAPSELRKHIASKLQDRFKSANLNIKTDSRSGLITFYMDESFLFVNDSYKLRTEVKSSLKNFISIYAEELFKDQEIRKHIARINITGHASPRFRSKPVSPNKANTFAYNHNLTLSANRALEMAKYIFSKDTGRFKYKTMFRNKTIVSGRSFAVPVKLSNNNSGYGKCGPYDCAKSRRVEISFNLKDEHLYNPNSSFNKKISETEISKKSVDREIASEIDDTQLEIEKAKLIDLELDQMQQGN